MRIIKLFIITCAVFCNIAHVYSQNSLNGVYFNEESINHLIIHGDTLSLLSSISHTDSMLDTLAQCRLKQCGNSFYELNSIEKRLRGKMEYCNTPSCQDSIIIRIVGSARYEEYDIVSTALGYRTLEFQSHNGYCEGRIPISFIRERDPHIRVYAILANSDELEGNRYWSPVCDDFFIDTSSLNESQNTIIINLTNWDQFFYRQLVEGEYIRNEGDTLIWRGCLWVKKEL